MTEISPSDSRKPLGNSARKNPATRSIRVLGEMARKKPEGATMGKAADNEILKLRATYTNNLAVGMALGAALLPFSAVVWKMDEFSDWMFLWWKGAATLNISVTYTYVAAFVFALVIVKTSDRAHRSAIDLLRQIQD